MAKAAFWSVTDAEARKRGEQTGLDTLVVPHKRWSMWFNSKQREEPYQVLTSSDTPRDRTFPFGGQSDRWCMVVVSSCREMLG